MGVCVCVCGGGKGDLNVFFTLKSLMVNVFFSYIRLFTLVARFDDDDDDDDEW